HIHHLVPHLPPFFFLVDVNNSVPLVPVLFQFLGKHLVLLLKFCFVDFEFAGQRGIVLSHFPIHTQFFQLHVELEHFFQQIGRHNLFLNLTGDSGGFSSAL